MATCKECLHVEVCKFKDLPAPLSDSYIRESECIEKRCGNFKDRSRFVELPKVGETVYGLVKINTFGDYRLQELKATGRIVDTNGVAFEVDLIGKRFFLTKEQAKQALKERESK